MFGFSIQEILPHIYHLRFESTYELAMHFLRFQEYYESPKYHRKIFSLVDYMEWYTKERGEGAFTYPQDWSGFNVPSWALHEVRRAHLPDPNKYDRFMFNLIDLVGEKEFPRDFYFIGTSSENSKAEEKAEDVLSHEIAHALYAINLVYRENVNRLINEWQHLPGHKREEFDSAIDVLKEMGYHHSTVEDEVHAYCATGLCRELEGAVSKAEAKPFQKLFKEFRKKCSNDQ